MANAHEFGFYFPYRRFRGGIACEPRHISYYTVANNYLDHLTPQSLAILLTDADIEGRQAILAHMNKIFSRYITNVCELP
jgi:hypothetical protein